MPEKVRKAFLMKGVISYRSRHMQTETSVPNEKQRTVNQICYEPSSPFWIKSIRKLVKVSFESMNSWSKSSRDEQLDEGEECFEDFLGVQSANSELPQVMT